MYYLDRMPCPFLNGGVVFEGWQCAVGLVLDMSQPVYQ